MITEIVGDLFTSPETFSLVHCVSVDLQWVLELLGSRVAFIKQREVLYRDRNWVFSNTTIQISVYKLS